MRVVGGNSDSRLLMDLVVIRRSLLQKKCQLIFLIHYSKAHNYLYTLRKARLQTSPAAVGISFTLSEGRGCKPRQRRWGSPLHSQKGEVANLASGGGDLFYTLRRARLQTSPAAVGISYTLSEGRGCKPRQRRWGSPLHRQIANSPVYT